MSSSRKRAAALVRRVKCELVAVIRSGVACAVVALAAVAGGVVGSFVADAILSEADIDYAYGLGVDKWFGLVLVGALSGAAASLGLILLWRLGRRSRGGRTGAIA